MCEESCVDKKSCLQEELCADTEEGRGIGKASVQGPSTDPSGVPKCELKPSESCQWHESL